MTQLMIPKIRGRWMILIEDKIVASGNDIKKIINEVQNKYSGKKFVLAKVPEEGAMIY